MLLVVVEVLAELEVSVVLVVGSEVPVLLPVVVVVDDDDEVVVVVEVMVVEVVVVMVEGVVLGTEGMTGLIHGNPDENEDCGGMKKNGE